MNKRCGRKEVCLCAIQWVNYLEIEQFLPRIVNEPQVVEYYPAKVYEEATVKTTYIEVEQVKETLAFILSRLTWRRGGEMGEEESEIGK